MHKVIFSAATALTLAVVFTGAASAFGSGCGYSGCNPSPSPAPLSEIKIENTDTHVFTAAKSIADTGENMQLGGVKQLMFTGKATSSALSLADVNTVSLPECVLCSNSGDLNLSIENKNTSVTTLAKSVADTGENMQVAGKTTSKPSWKGYKKPSAATSSQMMLTGDAKSTGQAVSTVNWVGLTDLSVE